MKESDLQPVQWVEPATHEEQPAGVSLLELLTWIGERKRFIAAWTLGIALLAAGGSLLLPNEFTARAAVLPPATQQGGSGAALAALGALGSLGALGGLAPKTPDELYVALLRSDSVQRALVERFDLKKHWDKPTYEQLRKEFPKFVRVLSDRKSGVIAIEVDDQSPQFAADFANACVGELTRVLGRLAVSEAQQRRAFFQQQLGETKENLVKAEQTLRSVQEKSGVIVLDKQAEALITGAAQLRAQIVEREVRLKVLRTGATEENPAVQRLASELRALRAELARMESAQGGTAGSAVDLPVGRLPEAGIEYVRARRELRVQEMLLESMIRQYEVAKLDEAKEGPSLQSIDAALPPDRKSKPQRALIVLAAALAALLGASAWVAMRRYAQSSGERDAQHAQAWAAFARAWRWRR